MARLPYKKLKQSGQAVLMIVLVLSVVLTLVVSAVTRSVVDLDITKYDDNAIRAFDAAQAGIERVLIGETVPPGTTLQSGATVTAASTDSTTVANMYLYPLELYSGESAVFWFVNHKLTASGDLIVDCLMGGCVTPAQVRFCWGTLGTAGDGNSKAPAIEIETYYSTSSPSPQSKYNDMYDWSTIQTKKLSIDPNTTRRLSNNFSAPAVAGGIGCANPINFQFSTRHDDDLGDLGYESLPNGSLILIRVTMLYNDDKTHPIGIRSSGSIPPQGRVITSTGVSGDATRKLSLYQGFPEFPFEFGSVIFSKGSITK
ncbi:MAG TPA: hypothetical protein VI819_00930 [Patescibacteria group bacterium]|nr:hypothetical protein [Patescibacteria group bacterium]